MKGFRFILFFCAVSGPWVPLWSCILCVISEKQWGTQYRRKWRLSSVSAPVHILSAHLAGDASVFRTFARLLVFVYDTLVTSGLCLRSWWWWDFARLHERQFHGFAGAAHGATVSQSIPYIDVNMHDAYVLHRQIIYFYFEFIRIRNRIRQGQKPKNGAYWGDCIILYHILTYYKWSYRTLTKWRRKGALQWGLGITTESDYKTATCTITDLDKLGNAFQGGVQVCRRVCCDWLFREGVWVFWCVSLCCTLSATVVCACACACCVRACAHACEGACMRVCACE